MAPPILDHRDAAAASLRGFVTQVCTDVVFRRGLRYRPAQALAAHGYEPARTPVVLPVRHYEVSVDFSPETLWGEPLRGAADLPGSASHSPTIETRLVRYGLKPMALVQAPAEEAVACVRRCAQLGLFAILSPYDYLPEPDVSAGGYVNLAAERRPAGPASSGWRTVVVARDAHQMQLGWLSLLFGWDEFLGLLLGYPACCVAAFPDRWRRACLDHQGEVAAVLLADAAASQVQAGHCCMNLFARYFGAHLTEHFPCAFDCVATVRLGERLARGLAAHEPALAAQTLGMLAAPVVFAPGEGAYLFPDGRWDDTHGVLIYSSVLASNQSHRLSLTSGEWRPRDGGTLMRFPRAA